MRINRLPPSSSPDLPDVLIHMTGRTGRRDTSVREAIREMTTVNRLASILYTRSLLAAPAFGFDWPVVAFTQTTRRALAHLCATGRYDGVGVAFHIQSVFEAGGGPAFYVRGDEFDLIRDNEDLPRALRARAVRYWPGAFPETADDIFTMTPGFHGRSTWMHEREWRLPRPEHIDAEWGWSFTPADVAFVLLGSASQADEVHRTIQYWSAQAGTGAMDATWIAERTHVALADGEWSPASATPGWL